jgi:hypothetical protein
MHHRPAICACLALCVALCAVHPAQAENNDADADAGPDGRWALSLSTQVDQQSTRGFTGSLGYDLTPDTTLRFAADSTAYAQAVAKTSFNASSAEVGASHDFEHFTIDAAAARWQDTDIVTAKELNLGGDFKGEQWSAGLKAGYRHADFDPFRFKSDVTLADGTKIAASTVSRCSLKSTAIGVDGRYAGDVWGGYATAMRYQYGDAACRFSVTGVGALSRADRRALRALTGGATDRLAAVATRRIGRRESLLDSSFDAGVSWTHNDLIVSADYSHQTEYFVGAASNTYSVTGTADLGNSTGVDCTVGTTRGGGVTSGAFVGFAVRARF